MRKRRKFISEFKSKVALEALREQQAVHEIAKRYQVHLSQVTEWKKALLGHASSVCSGDAWDGLVERLWRTLRYGDIMCAVTKQWRSCSGAFVRSSANSTPANTKP
jgi:hypothetical protein